MMRHLLVAFLVLSFPLAAFAQSSQGLVQAVRAQPLSGIAQAAPRPSQTQDRDRDSLKNGAIIGAVVLGAWCAVVCGQGLDDASQLPLAVLASAGMGAAIGAGIDSMHARRPRVMFRLRF
jgi:hypothetical protein